MWRREKCSFSRRKRLGSHGDRYLRSRYPEAQPSGIDDKQAGYFIVRTYDLFSKGKEIKRNDLITSIGGETVKLYITHIAKGSTYGGKFTLLKVYFQDREGKDV